MTTKKKAKRKLSDIDFSQTGASISLVGPSVGGPANGITTLVMKSMKNFSPEIIEKMQQIRVTMELPEFLSKFFNMYSSDALVLARLMGYEIPEETEDDYDEEESYRDYIESKLEAFEVMKGMYQADNLAQAISEVNEEEFLSVLRDQEVLEKAFSNETTLDTPAESVVGSEATPKSEIVTEVTKAVKKGQYVSWGSSGGTAYGRVERVVQKGSIKVPGANVTINADEGNPAVLIRIYKKNSEGSFEPTDTLVGHKANTLTQVKALAKANKVTKSQTKEVTMSDNTEEITVEVIAKAEHEAVTKALEDTKADLQKALDEIAAFKAEQKEIVRKARKSALEDVLKDEAKVEVLFKALDRVESDEEYVEILDVIKSVIESAQAKADTTMFNETGAGAEGEVVVKSSGDSKAALQKLLKSQYVKTKE